LYKVRGKLCGVDAGKGQNNYFWGAGKVKNANYFFWGVQDEFEKVRHTERPCTWSAHTGTGEDLFITEGQRTLTQVKPCLLIAGIWTGCPLFLCGGV
jgi:hypothetical protein